MNQRISCGLLTIALGLMLGGGEALSVEPGPGYQIRSESFWLDYSMSADQKLSLRLRPAPGMACDPEGRFALEDGSGGCNLASGDCGCGCLQDIGNIFSDGFECGDTSKWTMVVD